jgi:spore germination protein YaaH
MKYVIAILLYVFAAAASMPQDKSVGQIQSEYYSAYKFTSENDFDRLNNYHAPPKANSPTPWKHVFGWNPYWVGTAYTSYNYNLLTTVGYFSYEVDTATGSYTDIHFWRTTNLIPLAHVSGVGVVLTVTNFGVTNNTAVLSSALKRQRLIDSIISLVQFRQADGVNIDFESVGSSQQSNLVTFMTALASQMHTRVPGSKVSIDLPAVDWNNSFDITALNNVCDYMIVMGYDYYWSTAPNAGPCAPLQSGGFWGSYNVTNSVNTTLSRGAAAGKLLLGVPYYGYEWPTSTGSLNSTTTGTGTAYSYSTIKTYADTYGRIWDSYSLTPWYKYQSTTWHQGWYDDSVSLGMKYDLVNTKNMAGIGIWALSYDGSNNELWNLISTKFGLNAVHQQGNEIPKSFALYQNYPNPFNPATKIKFDVTTPLNPPEGGKFGSLVILKIYDALGREIGELVNESLAPGTYEAAFDASALASGIYYYSLKVGEFSQTNKMVLLK